MISGICGVLLAMVLVATAFEGTQANAFADERAPRIVRIALVSDTHTNEAVSGEQSLYRSRLEKAIKAVNAAHVDFVVITGDLTNDGKAEQMRDFQAQSKGFQPPVLLVPGNHDVGNKHLPDKPGGITATRVKAFEDQFGASFWARTVAGVRVIGINSLLMGSGVGREADQWAFLDKELAQPSPLPVIVVSHQPPYLTTANEPGGEYWNIEPEPRRRLLALLEQGGVCAFLSGHLHRSITSSRNQTLFFTTPPVSFGLPRGTQPQAWTLVTLTVPPAGRPEIACELRLIIDDAPPSSPGAPPTATAAAEGKTP